MKGDRHDGHTMVNAGNTGRIRYASGGICTTVKCSKCGVINSILTASSEDLTPIGGNQCVHFVELGVNGYSVWFDHKAKKEKLASEEVEQGGLFDGEI